MQMNAARFGGDLYGLLVGKSLSFKTTVVPSGFIAPISISTTVVLTFLVNQGRQLGDTRTSVKCS